LTKQAHIESLNASKSHDEKQLEKKQKKAKVTTEKVTISAHQKPKKTFSK